MKPDLRRHRRLAEVTSFDLRDNDHGIDTCWVHLRGIDTDGKASGWGQGFGGLVLNEKQQEYVGAICQLFNVRKIDEIVKRKCYALYAWDGAKIEGLDGRRFIQRAWIRQHFPKQGIGTALDEKRASILADIEWHKRRIIEQKQNLTRLAEGYVDWEAQ